MIRRDPSLARVYLAAGRIRCLEDEAAQSIELFLHELIYIDVGFSIMRLRERSRASH